MMVRQRASPPHTTAAATSRSSRGIGSGRGRRLRELVGRYGNSGEPWLHGQRQFTPRRPSAHAFGRAASSGPVLVVGWARPTGSGAPALFAPGWGSRKLLRPGRRLQACIPPLLAHRPRVAARPVCSLRVVAHPRPTIQQTAHCSPPSAATLRLFF
jgi:hypothetical protein